MAATTTRRRKPKTPERPKEIVSLYEGDHEARLSELWNQFKRAEMKESIMPRAYGQKSETASLAREYDALRTEAEETAYKITIQALKRRRWQELVAEFQPEEGNERHAEWGVHVEDFLDAIVPLCIIDPEFADEEWEEFSEELSKSQFDKLASACWNLNLQGVDLPKSSLVSRIQAQKSDD